MDESNISLKKLLQDRIAASWERAIERQLPQKPVREITKRSILSMDDEKRIKYQEYKRDYYRKHKDEFKARYEKNKDKAHERYLTKKANKLTRIGGTPEKSGDTP